MIRGVGRYSDYVEVAQTFERMAEPDTYQIFGHRNTQNLPIELSKHCFNLEGGVEFGGDLRVVTLDTDGFHPVYIKNTVFKEDGEDEPVAYTEQELDVMEMVDQMRKNEFITEKKYGSISSFNFTRQAFYDKKWNKQTTKARGLFINTENGRIIARSYDKFFNVNELPETKFDMLQYKLKFPVTAYVKENGFLGMVSYNPDTDDFFISSKSDPQGEFSAYMRSMFYQVGRNLDELKEYMKHNNVTFVFECVDMENDPHIIKYDKSELFLLDVVKNKLEFEKLPYSKLIQFEKFGFKVKKKAAQIDNWTDFYSWYMEVTAEGYLHDGKEIEGFVIEDSAGFMVKVKLYYYKLWKHMRSVAQSVFRSGQYRYMGSLLTPLENQFYGFVKELANDENHPTNIIALRDLFYATVMNNT